MKTLNTVAALLGEILSQDPSEMGPAFPLSPENGVDPMDVAKLAMACEQAFGFALFDEKVAAWRTLGDVCRHIDELLEEGLAEPTQRSDEDRLGWYYE